MAQPPVGRMDARKTPMPMPQTPQQHPRDNPETQVPWEYLKFPSPRRNHFGILWHV